MSWEIIRIAWQSLMDHKFRSFLTILSVTIGAFSIVVMTSLAESGSRTLTRSVEEIGGARLVWWVPDPPRDTRLQAIYDEGIRPKDVEVLRELPGVQLATGMASFGQSNVYLTADHIEKPDVVAIMDGMLDGMTWPMEQGRRFTPEENDLAARVVILTKGLEERLFPEGNALGKYVSIFNKPYKVVGVLKQRKLMGNMNLGFDWDLSVFIPISTAEKREGNNLSSLVLIAFTTSGDRNRGVMEQGSAVLKARHNGVQDFKVINFGDMMANFMQFFQAVNLIVAAIAGVSLFAGGIGVMNIMLVSVTERVKEIGIRKALGASRTAVLAQFLGEATFLSSIGGLTGVGAGLAVVSVAHIFIARWSEFWVSYYSPLGLAASMGVTIAIGLFFGAVPAWQAARLDIVECLRR